MSQFIDTDRLIRLGAKSDPDIRSIIQRFFELAENRIQSLATAAADDQLEALQTQLHQLKGSASTCGFTALEQLCRQWEDQPSSFNLPLLRETLSASLEAWRAFIAYHPI